MAGLLLFLYLLLGIVVYLSTTKQLYALEDTLDSYSPVHLSGMRVVLFIVIMLLFPLWLLLMNVLPYSQGPCRLSWQL